MAAEVPAWATLVAAAGASTQDALAALTAAAGPGCRRRAAAPAVLARSVDDYDGISQPGPLQSSRSPWWSLPSMPSMRASRCRSAAESVIIRAL